jgi:hypothetical protein
VTRINSSRHIKFVLVEQAVRNGILALLSLVSNDTVRAISHDQDCRQTAFSIPGANTANLLVPHETAAGGEVSTECNHSRRPPGVNESQPNSSC